jgi:hypothetical protein
MLELGILKTWNATTHKAGVQLVGSLTTYLDDIAVATNIPSSAMVVGNYVLVAIPGGNPRDACVVASWPAGSSGGGGGGTKIQDADADTSWDVEQTADEDKVHGKVKGVEAFLLDDAGVLTLAKQSRVAAYLPSNQNISTNTWTKINLAAEDYDEQGEFDITTNYRFTAKKAGYYFVVGQVRYVTANLPQTACYGDARKNGAESITMTFEYQGNGVEMGAICIHIFQLAVNDYLELWTWQNSGATQVARGYALCNRICIYKIG